ncbi:hypothetical protein GA0115253_110375 [Streptomyces sp. Termitarium-T10T-6]|nr:hypothetical protein [Streptomyces sp. Termitarium-T10T-6]SCE62343.1 hypothetical protein GA0115253_110375 [Streptomyces sp. Termitarium-T10T-6]
MARLVRVAAAYRTVGEDRARAVLAAATADPAAPSRTTEKTA